jgi:ribonuclease J
MKQIELIALGGCGEIGKNCTVLRQNQDLILIDCGLSFPTDEMYGVDIVIPDFSYLEDHRDEIRGVVITHGHEDHVGSLPYLLRQFPVPVWMSDFTRAIVEPKLGERLRGKKAEFHSFMPGDVFEVGPFEVETIRVTHSIPEACCLSIKTELGRVFHTGDFKFDNTPVDGHLTDLGRMGEIGNEGVLLMLSDSTGAETPGWGPSESVVSKTLEEIFAEAPGRIIVTTFASNIHRVQQVVDCAALYDRKFAVVGRRMEQNVEISNAKGYLKYSQDSRIRIGDVERHPDDRVVIITTGAQGEPLSALTLMAQEEYPKARIVPGDTVIISASPIPGNEALIWRTVNRLFSLGARVIYSRISPIHVSGHASQEELKMMMALIRPRYVAPVHGEPRHVVHYKDLARSMGYHNDDILTMDLGVPLVIDEEGPYLADPVPCGRVLVDSSGGSELSEEVARDRKHLANDGIVFVTVGIDFETGDIITAPDFIAKGFANGDEGLFEHVGEVLVDAIGSLNIVETRDVEAVQAEIRDLTRKVIRKRTQLRPIVVAVVLEL